MLALLAYDEHWSRKMWHDKTQCALNFSFEFSHVKWCDLKAQRYKCWTPDKFNAMICSSKDWSYYSAILWTNIYQHIETVCCQLEALMSGNHPLQSGCTTMPWACIVWMTSSALIVFMSDISAQLWLSCQIGDLTPWWLSSMDASRSSIKAPRVSSSVVLTYRSKACAATSCMTFR